VRGDRQFQAGDRVVCLKNKPRLGVLNGDLATVATVHPDNGTITIRLDRTGETRHLPRWYLDEGRLDWGYAITGHKAQGVTARHSFVVASDSVTKEWAYVAMSRGQQSNTLYLVDANPGRDCDHVTHQQSERLEAIASALERSDANTAAIDTERGPRTLSDEELARHLIHAERRSCDATAAALRDEAEARHRDRLAVLTYQPPPWITSHLGERPSDPAGRRAWNRIADLTLRYRSAHGVGDDEHQLLGPPPTTAGREDLITWWKTHQEARQRLADLRGIQVTSPNRTLAQIVPQGRASIGD
jgi:hypothetical protein